MEDRHEILKKTINDSARLIRDARSQIRDLQHQMKDAEASVVQELVKEKMYHCLKVDWSMIAYLR